MACCGERAPCLPSRTCSISSCTNSPAAVDGDLPSRTSLARSVTDLSGITVLPSGFLALNSGSNCLGAFARLASVVTELLALLAGPMPRVSYELAYHHAVSANP